MMQRYVLVRVMCMLVLVIVNSGCATAEHEPVDVEPVDFHVISESELSIDMKAMGDRLGGIAIISLDQSLTDEQRRQRILPLLNGIQEIAEGVKGKGVVTNYSVINRYMGSFLYDVANAQEFANRQPPNLVPAERLIKSCLSCHQSI